MIVEQRTYTIRPGRVGEFLALAESDGLPVLGPTLGNLIGYFSTEVGDLNQVVHLWAYDSLAEREARRAALAAKPEFQAYAAKVAPLIRRMENRILVPAPFNSLPLMAADMERS